MSFLHKRAKCFAGGGLAQHAAKAGAFFGHHGGDLGQLVLFHQALGLDQRRQGLGCQLLGLGLRHAVAFGGWQHAVDQAHFQGSFGKEGLAQQQCFGGAVVAQHLRHQQAGCGFRAQAQVDEGHGERRVVARVHQIAMEQHGGANAHRRAAHRGDHGLGEGGQAVQEAEDWRILRGRGLLQKVANVVARAEDGYVALEHHHAHAGVLLSSGQGVSHGGIHRGGDGVLLVHPVEGDGGHAGFGVDEDVFGGFGHGQRGE